MLLFVGAFYFWNDDSLLFCIQVFGCRSHISKDISYICIESKLLGVLMLVFKSGTKQISQSNSSVLFYWGNHGKPVVLVSSEETLHGCLCRPIWQEGCPFATLMVAGTQSRQPIFCHVRSVDLTRVWYRTATTWRYLSFLELLNPYVPDCWQPLSLKPNWWGLFITSLW